VILIKVSIVTLLDSPSQLFLTIRQKATYERFSFSIYDYQHVKIYFYLSHFIPDAYFCRCVDWHNVRFI